jgi:hypothetical protein
MKDPKIATAEENRRRFPDIAAFVDEVRAVFGDDVKVIWLEPYDAD